MIKNNTKPPVMLMVDDDAEDIYLTKRAFCKQMDTLVFVSAQTGSEMFDYLYCREKFSTNVESNLPDIILLDINIPKENGFEILQKLREDENFGHLPVSMLTTSRAPHDIKRAYQLGANSYISKSVSANAMKEIAENFCRYWFSFVELA